MGTRRTFRSNINKRGSKKIDIEGKQEYLIQGFLELGLKIAELLPNDVGYPNDVVITINESEILYTRTGNLEGIRGRVGGN